jgi:hypothetical protein
VVVVPDRRGQREDALQDPDDHPRNGASAISFQVELAFEGLVDHLDGLPQRLEQIRSSPFGFTLAGWPQQVHTLAGE